MEKGYVEKRFVYQTVAEDGTITITGKDTRPVCAACNQVITQTGGDSVGRTYFKCDCSEWIADGNMVTPFATPNMETLRKKKNEGW